MGKWNLVAVVVLWLSLPLAAYASALTLVLQTKLGEIRCELFTDLAPENVGHVVSLVRSGHFAQGVDVEVQPKFRVILSRADDQGKDPLTYRIKDELAPSLQFNQAGMLAVLADAPGDGGSRLYFNLVPTPHMNGVHTIIGRVVSGLDILQNAVGGPRAKAGAFQITSMRIEPESMKAPSFQRIHHWTKDQLAKNAAPMVQRLAESVARGEGWGKVGAQRMDEYSQRGRQYQISVQVDVEGQGTLHLLILAEREGEKLEWRHFQVRRPSKK